MDLGKHTFESLDDKGGCGGDDGDGSLPILDRELDSHPQTLPLRRCLRNVFSDLLGRLKDMVDHRVCNALCNGMHTRPKGPILGAREEEAPTSPPVARR